MTNIRTEIRPETEADVPAIREVTNDAFATAEHSSGTEALIVERLRERGKLALSLVAEREGAVRGHVAFSPVTINGKACGWFGLGPVSVHPEWQKRGIGTALINEGLKRLADMGGKGCALVGYPEYYSRFGFAHHRQLSMHGLPEEHAANFMAIAFTGEVPEGSVEFDDAFEVKPDEV
jgi:putative acetyltransferase